MYVNSKTATYYLIEGSDDLKYFSEQLIESFKVTDEKQIYNNPSIITNLEFADKIVMQRWLYNLCIKHKATYLALSIHLSDDLVYDQYTDRFIHSLLILHEEKPKHLYIHHLFLLNNNRIALISKNDEYYQIDIYTLLKIDAIHENKETLKWLKYKIAYENAPVLFENEIDYFQIKIK